MKKLLTSILALSALVVYADNIVYCDEDVMNQVAANHKKMDNAFAAGDGCTAGKMQVANHKIIDANIACFPNYKKGQFNVFHVMDEIDDDTFNNEDEQCEKARAKVMANHQKIKLALTKQDGCKAGKLELENHKTIQANLACFPKHANNLNYTEDASRRYNASAAK
jgi:hypothetical protein